METDLNDTTAPESSERQHRIATIRECTPEPCAILGTHLHPFCLGFHMLLKKLELPFADDPLAPASDPQLLTGIAICGLPEGEALRLMLFGEWSEVFGKWTKRLRGPWWNRKRHDLPSAFNLFRAYLADGYKSTPVWRYVQTSSGVKLSAPWELSLKMQAMRCGLSEKEAMSKYMPALWYDFFGEREFDQLKTCKDHKDWRKVFYTEKDAADMSRAKTNANAVFKSIREMKE